MLGGSTVLLFLGLPVAFSFLVINLLGALLFLGGEAGLVQFARNSLGSVASFSLTPIPLFIGGVVPGLILSVAFVIYIIARVKLNPALAPASSFTEYHGWAKLKPFVQYVIPLVSIFVVVVWSMSAGWATPTESAAIGALFTIFLALCYGALTPRNLLQSLRGTAAISGMILFIILGATTFSQILSFSGASNGLVELIAGAGLSPMAVIAAMMALLIF